MNKIFIIRPLVAIFSFFCIVACDKDESEVSGSVLKSSGFNIKKFSNTNFKFESLSLKRAQGNRLSYYKIGTQVQDNVGETQYGVLLTFENKPQNLVNGEISDTEKVRVSKITKATLILPYRYSSIAVEEGSNIEFSVIGDSNNGEPLDIEAFRSDFALQETEFTRNSRPNYFVDASSITEDFSSKIINNKISVSVLDTAPTKEAFLINLKNGEEDTTEEQRRDEFEQIGRSIRVELALNFLNDNISEDGTINEDSLFEIDNDLEGFFKGIYISPTNSNKGLYEILQDNTLSYTRPRIEVEFERETISTETGDVTKTEQFTESITMDTFQNEANVEVIETNRILNTLSFNNSSNFDFSNGINLKAGVNLTTFDLFGEAEDVLKSFFDQKIIVNKAVLRFKVNKNSPLFDSENLPNNLFVNSLENGGVLLDYQVLGPEIHLPNKIEQGDDVFYEVEITNYLSGFISSSGDIQEAIDRDVKLVLGISDDRNLNSLMLFDTEKEQRFNASNLLITKSLPLYGSDALQRNKPILLMDYTETK